METITWEDFKKVDIRVGTIMQVEDFPEAHNPSYKIWIDFGKDIWIKKTSAQITELYSKTELVNKQILWVVNFKDKQIANFISECLITWVYSEKWVILSAVDRKINNWKRLL